MKNLNSIFLICILTIIFGCTKDNPNDNGGGNSPTNNYAPSCSITSPQNGATFSLNDNISVTVSVADPDGTIAEVKLSIDNMEYQTITNSPYNFTITSGIISSGAHTIKAIAKDNDGASAESSIVIIIEGNPSGNNVAPTCIITLPQNGASFTYDENISVSVFAEDSDGTIAKVSLYIDNVGYSEITTFPYNFTIVSGVMSPGTHTIKAVAKDNGGSNGESSVTITIEQPATESPDFVSFSDGQIPPTWQTATWYVDNTGGYDDIYSLKVVNEGSVMTTKTIHGNGHLEFYAKGYYLDLRLTLYIDGSTNNHYFTTETIGSWTKYVFDIEEGTHTFIWEYNDEYCVIDAIRFVHNSNHPKIADYYQGGYIGYLDGTREHGYLLSENNLGYFDRDGAIEACANYSVGQYSDWYLPSVNDFNIIREALAKTNVSIYQFEGWYGTTTISFHNNGYHNRMYNYPSGSVTDWTGSCIIRAIRTF